MRPRGTRKRSFVIRDFSPLKIATPADLTGSVLIVKSRWHWVKKRGRIALDAILVFGVNAAQMSVILDMGGVFIPESFARAVLRFPRGFIP